MSRKLAALGLFVTIVALYMYHDQIFGLLIKPQPSFELSAATEPIVLCRYEGSSNSTIIAIKSLNGFQGTVVVNVTLKSPFMTMLGDIVLVYPDNITLAANEQASFELSFYVHSTTSPGTYLAEVVATDGKLESSVTVTLTLPP